MDTKDNIQNLSAMKKKDLIEVAEMLNITFPKSITKAELIETILENESELGCGMLTIDCMKTPSKGGYNIKQIKGLAKKCGIDITGLNRKQICQKINDIKTKSSNKPKRTTRRGSFNPLPRTNCGMSIKDCMKSPGKGGYTIDQIRGLAKKCGIDSTGLTRKQICEKISKK
jgi:hypothetical protein